MHASHAFINVIFIFLFEINSVSGDCSTLIDGYLPDPNDCSSYIQCGHGISYSMDCPAGLHWNWRINTCDYPSNAGCVIADISYVSPHYGSLNGETRLTIVGSGFSVNQYDAGNQVKLVSSYREYDCPVLKDGTTETRIICYTPQNMVGDTYYIRVSVDGEAVLANRHCGYPTDYRCSFIPSIWYTPTITSLEPQSQSGLPGGILHLNGRIFTGVYGSNVFPEEIKNGVTERILRVYAAGQLCEMKAENDTFYGFELSNGGYSTYGYIKCLMKGTFVGNFNASFIIEGHYGRSLPQKEVIRVAKNDDIYMYQTYAVINGVSPSSGSTQGRTRLSITGQYFDETEKPVRVVVGGAECKVTETVTDGLIVCETDEQVSAPRYSGNRGLLYERHSDLYYSLNDLTKILDLTPDDNTTTKVIDHFYFSDLNIGGNHVTRIHGFYIPPHSGRWTFHLQCYYLGKLYLSTNQDPANKVELAYSSSSYGYFMSDVIELEKDKHYYIEVLQSGVGSSTIRVAARHLDTKFNDRMTGMADQEKQSISVTSSVEREIQSVQVQMTSTGAKVYEKQQVTIEEDAGYLSDAKFQLGFYGVFTEPFDVITEGEVMAYALSSLPFLDGKESVTITTAQLMEGPPGIVINITMVSERGNFPDIDVKVINGTAGETLSTKVTELVKGVPSGNYYVLHLASKPSPLLPVEANAGQVKKALDLMFGTRCPSFLKEPPAFKIFFDHEAKSQSGVAVTMEIEPFCGQYVGKNPSSLYAVTDSSSKGLSLTSKVNVNIILCFAYLGNQLKNGIGITYSYEDFNGTIHNATNSIPLTFERKSGWHYVCVEIFSAVKGFQPQGSSFYIRRIYVSKNDYTRNFYIDDIYIGLEQPTENVEVVNSYRMLPVSLGSTRIDRVDVRSTGEGLLEVTFVPYLCGHKIPLLTVEPGQVGSGVQIDIKRLQAASPPISGTFSITFKNKTKSGIPHDTSSAALTDILESIDGIGAISVYRYGTCSNFYYHIRFTTLAGDQPQIQVNSSLAGRKVVVNVNTLTNGGLWYNPIPGDMLYTDHSKPQVLTYVNNVPTLCTNDCSYEWSTASTPTVTGINPVTGAQGTEIKITGTKLGSENSTVTIGGVPCVITAATATSITCTVGEGSYGTYEVVVIDGGKGKALHDGTTLTFDYSMEISGISPTFGTIGGGITLTLSGYGFSPSAEVTIGSKACEVTSAGPVEIVCIIPDHPAGDVDVKVSVDDHEELCLTKFAYLSSDTPIIGTISPTIFEVLGGGILTISVSNFASNGTLKIGSTDVPIATINDTHITAVMPSLPPGTYEVLVFNGSNGAGVHSDGSRPTIQYQLSITNVFPQHGSMYGGTRLTLTGQGFSAETPKDKITVSIGNHNCGVESVSSSQIVCLIDETAAVVKIDNQGVHPHWGIGYQWNPLVGYLEAGDIVEWTWTSQPWILTFTHRIEQTKSESSTERTSDGFISGTKGTYNGMFRYQVTTPGEFQYWSGYTDYYEIVYYRGTLMVTDKQPFVANVSVKVGEHEALYNTNSGTSDPADSSNCPGLNSLTCQDLPDLSPSSIFQFSFDMCHSPTVTLLGRDNATAVDTVTIFGSGFSTTACNNEVTFGDANCIVKKATESSIECMIDSSNSPMIAVRQDVAVRVNNLGYALLAVEGQTARTLVVLPVVMSISPEMVSTNGGAVVNITGAGFQGDASDISVIINGYDCPVQYVSYTQINCIAPPSGFGTKSLVVKISVNDMTIPAVCDIECQLVYESAISPEISDITPNSLNGDVTTFTITGSGFSTVVSNAVVKVGDESCSVEAVKDSQITCTITHAPVGDLTVDVVINDRGRATKSKSFFVTSQAVISSILPTQGSIYGGTEIVITGNGFIDEKTVVSIDGSPCDIKETNLSRIVCVTRSGSEGNASVVVVSNSVAYAEWIFEYSSAVTPIISDLSPMKGTKGTSLVITGSKFGLADNEIKVTVGNAPCEITFFNMTMIECTISEGSIGTATVLVIVEGLGVSNSDVQFEFEFAVTGIQKSSGSVSGGQTITVMGSGFDNTTNVTICEQTCTVDDKANQSASEFICVTPPSAEVVTGTKSCDVITTVDGVQKPVGGGYTYSQALTPDITSVSPARGGTGGGVSLTIRGAGFGIDKSVVVVKIAGTQCNVSTVTDIEIVCITGKHSPSQKTKVWVEINGNGMATQTDAEFYYIDVWSSPYTWGGLDPPEDGTLVVIPAGNIILLDISTARLKMLLIKGGELVFDEKDIELLADNILIVEGGRLQIGTESEPFQHKAYITGTAHLRTKELPIYGTNSLGIREGVLDLHGKPVPVVWTHLASTAVAGSDSIVLEREVTWQSGDEIVIATTGGPSSQRQNEKHTIKAVADSKTLTLVKPLEYKHLGESETIGSHIFEYRAEVGLLTRNIVLRGERDRQWTEFIPACPRGFSTGEFATQTCFQGRFGEEIGSDKFGMQVMFHPPEPNKNLTVGRVSYVEFTYVGQAFRLGRYPFHLHLAGDMSSTYIKGCSIHESFNRAVNIHGSHNALVENNVIYNTKGGTVFLEDGIETGNKLLYNLVIFVRESSSLVNDDVTPAAFWITHPGNIVEHNVAVGGTHFGFWYRMHTHPDGPSSTSSVCPQKAKLGSFSHNTAHSFGWYGFWIFTTYTPRTGGSCWSGTPQPTVFDNFYAWRNRKGAESVKAGALQFHNFTLVSNSEAGYEEITHLEGEWYSQNGALFKNGVIVGTSPLLGGCTASGISLPDNFGFMVDGTEFINFNVGCTAFSVKHATDHNAPGGFHYRTQNLKFTNVGPTNGASVAEFEASFMDLDGTAKTNIPGSMIAPTTDMHPPNCTDFEFFSAGVPMSLCTVNVLRFSFNNLQRGGLYRGPIRFENQYGNTTINWERMYVTHPLGYMIMISTREEYTMHFDNTKLNTNVSFSGTLTLFNADDWLIFTIELGGTPDCVYVFDRVCRKNGTETPLDPEEHFNGDWYYDKSTGAVSFLVSRKGRGALTGVQYNLNFQCFKCYFKDCIVPPKPETVAPVDTTLGGVDDAMTWWGLGLKRWSDPTIWPNNTIPQEGDDVAIECGTWVLADIEIPPLGELFICGVLEFDNENYTEGYKNFTVNVTRIIIYGGRLIVGWEKRPFMGNFLITLRGNASDETYELPNGGDNIGSKVIGDYGGLDLHGKPINVPWTTLNTTAYPDDSTIKLNTVVDWEVEQEIVVTPTGYSAWETETFQITNVQESDGMSILTLNDTIQYRHLAYNENGVDITAEVGLLTRNVKVQSEDYPDLYEEKYGGRVIVGQTEFSKGYARISNTEFYHMGQDGKNYRKAYDPRFAVSFVDSGPVSYIRPSYIRNCSFHNGFSPVIGIFSALYLPIEDNVIHGSHFYAIITDSYGTIIRRNVVTMTQNHEADLLGAISAADATDLVLENNRVSGSERAAYDIAQPCNASSSKWYSGNIGRSSLYGVITTQAEIYCNRICGFILVKCGYYGVYYDGGVSAVFENLVLADNPISISITITGPSATSHQYADKTAIVNNSVIVGTSPVFDCTIDRVNKSEKGIEPLLKKGPFGQRIGIPFATFSSGSKSPMAIKGLLTIENVEFRNFTTACSSRDNAITTNPSNNDGAHPVETSNIKFQNVERKHKIYFHRPNLGLVNPADCVDMDCDGLKKGFLKDLDGTFLGTPGAILPHSEWEWDGDPRRGLGDYRVPKTMLTMLNGTRIPMSTLAPMKGIIRENDCVYESDWNAYVCHEFDYLMMVIESMDSDSTSRRLSPVALLGHNSEGEGVIDLMNGPQDHGWCSGYACKSRLSTFQAIVATGKNYQLYFTSTSPRSSRYFLLNADDSQAVRIAVWYSQPYRMDVYYQKKLVLPVNGRFGIDNAYILSPPPVGEPFAYHPNATKDPAGTNWFDRDSGLLYFVVRGSDPINIVTTKQIIVSCMYPAMTASDFYSERIVELLAAFLDVPPSKVRIVNIVSAQQNKRRRRKRSTERDQIVVEIGDVPNDDFNTTADDAITDDHLQQMYAKIVTEGEVGNISEIVNATVLGLGVAEPTLDPSDPNWARVTTDDGYRILIQVDHLDFETTTLTQYEGTIFPRQPKICAYDKGGYKINDLGTDLYPWNITATLRQGTGNPDGVLSGNTTIPFVNGEANFSNLEISHPGIGYIIDFNMTEPIEAENLTLSSAPLDIQKIPVTAVIVSATEDVYTTESMVIQMELREELTGNKLDNIGWRSHEWNVQAEMGTPEYYNGSLHGSNQKFWGSSSQATFSDLTFTSFGMAIINFRVTTNPPEYNFTIPHYVNVKQLQHKSMIHEETNDIVLKIDGDYNTVVGSDDRYAKAMFGNWFAVMYEDLQINSVSLQPGSILVTLNVSGSHDSINSSLYSTCSMLTDGQTINYNGQALELSKYMYYNGSVFYGEACEVIPDNDDSSEVPMAIIVGSVVGCVLLIVIILVVWRMKSQSKNKIKVTGGLLSCGCGTGSNEKDTDEILYRERSFMSFTGSMPKESVSRDQSFVSVAPSATEFKAPRLTQAWNSNF